MNDLHWMTLVEAAGAMAARKLSPVELMSALLERIGRLDPKLNVFIRLDAEAAMEEARAAEAEIVPGRLRGPLHGVPVGIKDIIDVAGLPTTCHSKILIDNVARADAVCVSRLRGAGAIVLGKLSPTNLRSAALASISHGRRHATHGIRIIIPAARPRDQALALLPACSRWRWAATRAAACAIQPAPAASSG